MDRHPIQVISLLALLLCFSYFPAGPQAGRLRNIALHATYTFDQNPNYPYTTDPEDKVQLTDGVYSTGRFWMQKSSVGWTTSSPIVIRLDLGSVKRIRGFSFDTAAGTAGVDWPLAIKVLVSNDGSSYSDATELVSASAAAGRKPAERGYSVFRYWTDAVVTGGRYVAFMIFPNGPYVFCDEVEVYESEGREALRALPTLSYSDLEKAVPLIATRVGVARRLRLDSDALKQEILASSLKPVDLVGLLAKLESIGTEHPEIGTDIKGFSTAYPQNLAHARIFGLQAELWRTEGCPDISIWRSGLWDPLDPIARPGEGHALSLNVAMMEGEFRSASINLAASTASPLPLRIFIEGPASEAAEFGSVELFKAIWSDTRKGDPVSSALIPLAKDGADSVMVLEPGLVQQLWIRIHPKGIPASKREWALVIAHDGSQTRIPLELDLRPLTFPDRPRLHLGGWDYTDQSSKYGLTRGNRESVVKVLRDYFVDSPWGTGNVMPFGKLTADGGWIEAPPTDSFDSWIAAWPGMSRYCVFLAVGDDIDGTRIGEPAFEAKVAAWIRFWARHSVTLGVSANKLTLLLGDEPRNAAQTARIIAWGRAIKRANTGVRIWEDPSYADPATADPALFYLSDSVCVDRILWLSKGAAFRSFYRELVHGGHELEFYSPDLPSQAADPYAYYLVAGWQCFVEGATGEGFWSFSDVGGGSWNEYAFLAQNYSPLFLEPDRVVSSKQMEAIREGVEDYEYLSILSDAILRSDPADSQELLAKAKAFLKSGPERVLDEVGGAQGLYWVVKKPRSAADEERRKALDLLSAFYDHR